jgi:hypothetical protein
VRVSCRGEQTEVGGLLAAVIQWLITHEGDLSERDTGTVTVDYSNGQGRVVITHLGRDTATFSAPRR